MHFPIQELPIPNREEEAVGLFGGSAIRTAKRFDIAPRNSGQLRESCSTPEALQSNSDEQIRSALSLNSPPLVRSSDTSDEGERLLKAAKAARKIVGGGQFVSLGNAASFSNKLDERLKELAVRLECSHT